MSSDRSLRDLATEPVRPAMRADVILFAAQIILIFIVVFFALYNITVGSPNENVWLMILSASMGYMMPNPKIKGINAQALDEYKRQANLIISEPPPLRTSSTH